MKSLAFSPDGRQLAAGKYGEIRILDIESGETLSTRKSLREVGDVNYIAFSPDGKSLLAAGFRGNSVAWPVDESVQWDDQAIVSEHSRPVEAFTIDSKTLRGISTSQDKAILFSYERGGHRTRTVDLPWRKTVGIRLLKNGTQMIATDGRELLRIDFVSGEKSQKSLEGKGYPHAAVFTSDGSRLAISRGSNIELIDTKTAKTIHTLERRSVQWSVLFSVDDKQLFSGDRGTIQVWDVATGQWKSEVAMQSIQYVKTMAVSSDGQYLAAIPGSSIEILRVIRIPQ